MTRSLMTYSIAEMHATELFYHDVKRFTSFSCKNIKDKDICSAFYQGMYKNYNLHPHKVFLCQNHQLDLFLEQLKLKIKSL